jgi:hypothetical protein
VSAWVGIEPEKWTHRICQTSHVNVHLLTCPDRESGGYQCERLSPHGDDAHWIGPHTIEHSLAGSGYACEAFRVGQ